MPGMDPFSHIRPPFPPPPASGEDNNNLLAAAEKARMMMMYRAGTGAGAGAPLVAPALPTPPSLPLSPELLARYSLGLYNPALLAAMVRTSAAGSLTSLTPSSPFLPTSLPTLSPKSPTEPASKTARFSPYVLPPSTRPSESPSRFSNLSDGEAGRSPSPRSSPPTSRPPLPLHYRWSVSNKDIYRRGEVAKPFSWWIIRKIQIGGCFIDSNQWWSLNSNIKCNHLNHHKSRNHNKLPFLIISMYPSASVSWQKRWKWWQFDSLKMRMEDLWQMSILFLKLKFCSSLGMFQLMSPKECAKRNTYDQWDNCIDYWLQLTYKLSKHSPLPYLNVITH